ncbi:MAG: TIGR02117 family protein [Bacteroidia bacterium]|nr:TIGR02117 family protein [Bacteroidia bacterium]
MGCANTLPKIKANWNWTEPESGIEIFVKSNGVHTDLVVPVKSKVISWDSTFHPSSFKGADSTFEYLAFGWGDKGFYLYTPTWADLKFSTAFKAAFWLGESAMHVTYYQNSPKETERCKKIIISEEQYRKLISYIKDSFKTIGQGSYVGNSIIRIDHPGYGNHDKFYEGKGTYNLFKTCNEWTGDGLEECGVKIGLWTPLQGGIIDEIE